MRLMSKQSTNQWIRKTCVTNIFLTCLLTTEALANAAAAATTTKQHPGFAKQLQVTVDDSSASNLYHQPHFTGNRSVIVQLFEWKFLDIAEECRTFLGPHGYAGVQLSPVLEHTLVKSSTLNHPWWERYEVISYRLASRSGDESDFWAMSRICNDNGVRIYADVILNHMAAPLHFLDSTMTNEDFIVNTLLEQNVNISHLNYPNVSYTQQDFHRPCNIGNAHDAHQIRNCQLNGHPDLDHSQAAVQRHIVKMLNKFIHMGVAGFRIDTAKHIWPIDLKKMYEQVNDLNEEFNFVKKTRPFFYHDVFDLGLDSVSKTEYSTYGVVSEYLYPAELSTILNSRAPLSSLINWGPAMGFLAHQDSLVFIDSPDTQRGLPIELGRNYMLTYKQRIKYIMANAFMLAHPYGHIKRIMSSYYYAEMDVNQGPPFEEEDENVIRSPKFNEQQQCTIDSGWVCEHRWPPLVHMVGVANYFRVLGQKEESIIHFQTNGPNQIAFCRGYKLFIAMNNDHELDFITEIYTCMEPGTYCDIITGGKKEDEQSCHGRQLVVNEHGYAQLVLPVADGSAEDENSIDGEEGEDPQMVESYGVLVVYVGSKLRPKVEPEVMLNTGNVDAPDIENDEIDAENEIETSDEVAEISPEQDEPPENENNEEDNDMENTVHSVIAEKADQPQSNLEDSNENIDQPVAENEGHNEDEPDVNEGAAEENESPKPIEDGAKTLLQENEEVDADNPDNPEESNVETAAGEQSTEEDAEKSLTNELEEYPEDINKNSNEDLVDAAEALEESLAHDNITQEVPEISKESATEIETLAEDDVAETTQTENTEEIEQMPEEQLEKPSADIVDVVKKETDTVQNVQSAGLISKSQKYGHPNG